MHQPSGGLFSEVVLGIASRCIGVAAVEPVLDGRRRREKFKDATFHQSRHSSCNCRQRSGARVLAIRALAVLSAGSVRARRADHVAAFSAVVPPKEERKLLCASSKEMVGEGRGGGGKGEVERSGIKPRRATVLARCRCVGQHHCCTGTHTLGTTAQSGFAKGCIQLSGDSSRGRILYFPFFFNCKVFMHC